MRSLPTAGELTLDAATGRPLTGAIDGRATMAVFQFGTATASFKMRLMSSTLESPALAMHAMHAPISLLGVPREPRPKAVPFEAPDSGLQPPSGRGA